MEAILNLFAWHLAYALFLAISHEAMHLGQLAAWRRSKGLPSALPLI